MAQNRQKRADTSANYVPTLKAGNPLKTSPDDWWDDLCAKHNAKNHWKKEEKKKSDEENKEEKESK